MKQLNFNKGEVILEEGEISDNAFIVLDGAVEVTKSLPDGTEKQLAILEKNSLFGECGLVDSLPRTATCKAHTNNLAVGVVTKENYHPLVKPKPDSLLPILRIITQRMRDTLEFVDQIYGNQLKK